VCRELATDFEVVATAADGRQALSAAQRLEPELVVLDITMPELDGFQTLRELKRLKSRAKIVFLTMHGEDEHILEALRCGANGYVLKIRARSDLRAALDHVRAGRLFLPTPSPLALAGHFGHVVQFYADDDHFLDSASRFLSTALGCGDSVGVNLNAAHRSGIAQRLQVQGWDITQMKKQGRYVEFDAADVLSRIMREDGLDEASMAAIIDDIERARLTSPHGPHCRMTLCGELAGFLCSSGRVDVATEIERIWHDRTGRLPFLTLCPYPLAPGTALRSELFANIWEQHSVVSHACAAAQAYDHRPRTGVPFTSSRG
jgi:DNA-binding NarL/FixJ family response regulator